MYPKFGPGQMWTKLPGASPRLGVLILLAATRLGRCIDRVAADKVVSAVDVLDEVAGAVRRVPC